MADDLNYEIHLTLDPTPPAEDDALARAMPEAEAAISAANASIPAAPAEPAPAAGQAPIYAAPAASQEPVYAPAPAAPQQPVYAAPAPAPAEMEKFCSSLPHGKMPVCNCWLRSGTRAMGRAKYSAEMVNEIMAAFVTAARTIIAEEGLEAASIRRVSTMAGYSSGTLYLYFADMDELISMALVSYLNGYVRDLIGTTDEAETPAERYRRSWTLFCKHGLAHPDEYLELFFGPKSGSMDAIAKKYYELFPEELHFADGLILTMLERGSLLERNRAVLEPVAAERGMSERDVELANDLTVAYFHMFLLEAAARELSEEEIARMTERFLEGAFFAIR